MSHTLHPVTEEYPEFTATEIETMRASLRVNGLIRPIVIWQGRSRGGVVMTYVPLGELQRLYIGGRNAAFCNQLRSFLFDGVPATSAVYAAVSHHLYATGLIDKHGLEAVWLSTATEADRALVFSRIATGRQS
jgi:hypothetical protein